MLEDASSQDTNSAKLKKLEDLINQNDSLSLASDLADQMNKLKAEVEQEKLSTASRLLDT